MPNRPAIRVSEMLIGFDAPTVIKFKKPLRRAEANFIHVLGEFPNRPVPVRDICARLNMNAYGVMVQASKVRRFLTSDWTIQAVDNGYRLIDLRDK